jgi:NAD(P)-dependent dehydrogenase (short-subunit alcohol dehydrogenase family)
MGLQLVNLLLSLGHQVIATSRNKANLEKGVTGTRENLFSLETDITSDEEVKKAIDLAVAHFGHINVVVNNAGYSLVGSMEEMSDEEFRSTINVNLFGTVNIIRNVILIYVNRDPDISLISLLMPATLALPMQPVIMRRNSASSALQKRWHRKLNHSALTLLWSRLASSARSL